MKKQEPDTNEIHGDYITFYFMGMLVLLILFSLMALIDLIIQKEWLVSIFMFLVFFILSFFKYKLYKNFAIPKWHYAENLEYKLRKKQNKS